MTFRTLSLTLSALLLSSVTFLTHAADDTTKPTADQGTSMPQPDSAATDQAAKPDKDAAAQMKTLDPDNDGTVDKAEAGKMKGLAEVFDTADKNKDGKLDSGELATAMSQIKK